MKTKVSVAGEGSAFTLLELLVEINREVAGALERGGLHGLGFSLGVATNLLPDLRRSSTATWHSLRMRGGLRGRWLRGLQLLLLAVMTNALRHAEEIVLAAETRAFLPEKSRSVPLKRGRLDGWIVLAGVLALFMAVAGYVPLLGVFDQLPALRAPGADGPSGCATPEVGLFWAIDPAHQRQGYATEAARALVVHALNHLRLRRIVATTEYDNLASQAVMRKLGMSLERNPQADPLSVLPGQSERSLPVLA